MSKRNIYLVGFMGTGKSTVGRELARFLGRPFIDLDAVLEKRLGLSINEIFTTHGEKFFREQEKKTALELAQSANRVIAAGGGTILDPEVADVFKQSGLIICLFTGKEELLDRLGRSQRRPILAGTSLAEKEKIVEDLLEKRSEIYNKISIRVDTTNMTPVEAAKKIIVLLRTRQRILDKLQSQYIVIS